MSASREKKKRLAQGDVAVTAAPETKKGLSKSAKKALYAVVAVVLVAAIVLLGLVSSGFFTTHSVAGIANGHKLTPAMLNFHYASAYQELSSVLSYMVDPEKPLSEQEYMTDDFDTWHDYLIDAALNSAASTYAIYDEAIANGYELSENAKETLKNEAEMMDLYAAMSGASSGDAYIASMYGTGCNVENYIEFATISYTAQEYVASVYQNLNFSSDEIAAHYAANPGDFDAVSFRQFNVTAAIEEGKEAPTDEALAEAEKTALAMAEESQGNVDRFLELCLINTADDKKADFNPDSTLRSDVAENDIAEIIRSWLADDARQAGDTTAIFNGKDSYHVLFFVEQVDHNYQLPNVRHILINADGTDEEAKATAKAEAEALLAEFLAGNATEDAFAALANEKSDDTGSNTTGGLYENIAPGSMVPNFNDWCFDATRQAGDTGIVESDYGYHIMYFSGYGDVYHDYLVETALINAAYSEWQAEITSNLTWELVNSKFVASR